MLPMRLITRLRRVYCQKTALNKISDSAQGYFPPHERLTVCPTLLPAVASRSARDARPWAGHNSQLRWRWRVARSHAGQQLLKAPPPTLAFSLLETSPIGGLGGCRTERKGAVAIGVADLFLRWRK